MIWGTSKRLQFNFRYHSLFHFLRLHLEVSDAELFFILEWTFGS